MLIAGLRYQVRLTSGNHFSDRRASRPAGSAAAHALSMVGGRMLGLTLNRIPRTSPDETYGYSDDAASLPAPDTSVRGVEGFVPFKQSVRQSASAQQTPGAGGQPAARESSR